MNKPNWDDIRYVLAVADTGSLNAAASQLGVTHATVLRRVALFEDRHGQAVFQKLPTGYRVLPEAEPVLLAARNVQDSVLAVDRAFLGADQSLLGTVRIASTDSVCKYILPGIVRSVSHRYPNLTLKVFSANTRHDFLRLSADIAVRPAPAIEEGMSGRKVGALEFGLYRGEICGNLWLSLDGPLQNSPAATWMRQNLVPGQIGHGADSFVVLQELVAAGAGKAILPRFVGDADPRLTPVPGCIPAISTPIWVATLEVLAGNARFRAVQDILSVELGKALQPFTRTGDPS